MCFVIMVAAKMEINVKTFLNLMAKKCILYFQWAANCNLQDDTAFLAQALNIYISCL